MESLTARKEDVFGQVGMVPEKKKHLFSSVICSIYMNSVIQETGIQNTSKSRRVYFELFDLKV